MSMPDQSIPAPVAEQRPPVLGPDDAPAANPEMEARKRMGVKAVLFLALLSGLTYAVKKKVWKDVH